MFRTSTVQEKEGVTHSIPRRSIDGRCFNIYFSYFLKHFRAHFRALSHPSDIQCRKASKGDLPAFEFAYSQGGGESPLAPRLCLHTRRGRRWGVKTLLPSVRRSRRRRRRRGQRRPPPRSRFATVREKEPNGRSVRGDCLNRRKDERNEDEIHTWRPCLSEDVKSTVQ